MSKAKKRLKNFDFSGGNAAVALVHEMQGGAANGTKTLVMKATDVVVELTMAEFLMRFFGIWSGEAKMLANILGYSDDITDMYDYGYEDGEKFSDKVTLMKSMKGTFNADTEVPESLQQIIKQLAEKSNIKITDLNEVEKNTDGVSKPNSETQETPSKEVSKMTDKVEMIEKSAVQEMIRAEIEKAVRAKDALITDLENSVKDFEAEKINVKKATFIEKAKDFEVLGVENFEEFGIALMKMAGDESMKAVMVTLETAVNIAKNVGEFEEEGHSLEADHASGVEAILKSRGSIK